MFKTISQKKRIFIVILVFILGSTLTLFLNREKIALCNNQNQINCAKALSNNFTVQGKNILDPDGNVFINQGINMFAWQGTEDLDNIINCWGFNSIRVPIYLTGQYGQPNPADDNYQNVLDIATAFTSQKKVVVFDAHDMIGTYYNGPDLIKLKTYWRKMAQLFKNNPYVWFDLSNEPDTNNPDLDKWASYHQDLIKIIRDEELSDNIILVEGTSWGQDAGDWDSGDVVEANSAILSRSQDILNFNNKTYNNIVFSIHIYEQWNGSQARLTNYLAAVRNKNLPMIIGEYGSINNTDSTLPATQFLFNEMKNNKIGHFAWVWKADDENDLTTGTGGNGSEVNSCSSPTNLTPLGDLIWKDLHPPIIIQNLPITPPNNYNPNPTVTINTPTSQPDNKTKNESALNIGNTLIELTTEKKVIANEINNASGNLTGYSLGIKKVEKSVEKELKKDNYLGIYLTIFGLLGFLILCTILFLIRRNKK
jgi:hypothetical protein